MRQRFPPILPIFRNKNRLNRDEIADLYQRTGALVLRRCVLILRDEEEAKDILQDVFVRLMRYDDGIQSQQIPLSWLYRTAERCCFDRLKRKIRDPIADPRLSVQLTAHFDEQAKLEASEIVLRYFFRLDPKLQQLALLYYVDGLPQEEIARELKWSRRTVGKKLKELYERGKKLQESGKSADREK